MAASEELLKAARSVFGSQMTEVIGAGYNVRLRQAFASVPREKFLGDPPWYVPVGSGVQEIYSRDPIVVYQDQLFLLDADKQICNGRPSLHALGLNELYVSSGDSVLHLGCGTGYYTAMLCELVGPEGRVSAVELDNRLALAARQNLSSYKNAEVHHGSGSDWPKHPIDVIYVNYAVQRPNLLWIDLLKEGGRAIFPLGVPAKREDGRTDATTEFGAFVHLTKRKKTVEARWLGPVRFICDPAPVNSTERDGLEAAFRKGGVEQIIELRVGPTRNQPEWFSAPDWGLVIRR